MKTIRQDAWTAEDDTRLAEIVLRHIREGSTQLAAFEEAAELLNRTAAACGYRWNACIRKHCQPAIDVAKRQRKARGVPWRRGADWERAREGSEAQPSLSWGGVIRFLRQYKQEYQGLYVRVKQLERDLERAREELAVLREEREELAETCERWKQRYQSLSDDYRTMLGIMDRAERNVRATEVCLRRAVGETESSD
ncbi:MAG: RsfA family transcriptional regulator [Kyrpidia tusciae]|nr:RsfA family transcriptional regulator [Kyrpidia tusciae]MBE3551378.1 RsfA family transcriptional regulator [Kyrpidia tusciae]